MTINGLDAASTYHMHIEQDLSISPATVITYNDWLRKARNPLFFGTQEQFIQITFTAVVEDLTDDLVIQDISALSKALEQCTIQFDGITRKYDCYSPSLTPTRWALGKQEIKVQLQSSYAYLDYVTHTFSSNSGSISYEGNLNSPPIITLVSTSDLGSIQLSGLTDNSLTISNISANVPITIDSEKCTIMEPDIETFLHSSNAQNKWILKQYSISGLFNPITMYPYSDNTFPIPDKTWLGTYKTRIYNQSLITDSENLFQSNATDYLGYLKTAVVLSKASSWDFYFYHDDSVNILVNGVSVFSHNRCEDGVGNPGHPFVTISLSQGINTIEIIWLQHVGASGVWGFAPPLSTSTAVSQDGGVIDASKSCNTASTLQVNKFPDVNLYDFPEIAQGVNTFLITGANSGEISLSVKYKPKFI